MKGALNTWVLVAGAAALVALPADVRAQASPATAADVRETESGQRRLAQKHLHEAGAAIDRIALDEQPTDIREHIGELKRRLNALRQDHGSAALEPAAQEPTSTAERPDGVNREAQLAAIDRTLTALLGSVQTTGATPRPHGTPAATSGQPGIEQTARTHLEQARTHITAYAAAMGSAEQAAESGAPSDGVGSPAAMAASAPPSTADATATTSPTDPTPSPTGTSPTDMPQTPAAPGPAEYDGALGASEPVPQSRRHLLAARDTLASLTQMPQAAGITGDARVQVSQLITRFNELIATNAAWREPLDDVKRRLNTLLTVDDRETPREAATGTSGTVVLDPDVRAKLVEFRSHLETFERSAGGQATGPGQQEASSSITEATPGELATRASETDPTAASGSTSTGAAAAQMPGAPAGTVVGQPVPADAISDAAEAGRHIDAIEAILRRARGAHAGVTGTSGSTTEEQMTAGRSELEPSEIEAIRTHLNELRRLLDRREP